MQENCTYSLDCIIFLKYYDNNGIFKSKKKMFASWVCCLMFVPFPAARWACCLMFVPFPAARWVCCLTV